MIAYQVTYTSDVLGLQTAFFAHYAAAAHFGSVFPDSRIEAVVIHMQTI